MTLTPSARRVLLAVISLVLIGLAWLGITGGIDDVQQSKTSGQFVQTLTQLGYGLFALLSVVTTFRARRWNLLMLRSWTFSFSLSAGLASVVWGGTSLPIGLLSGAGAFLIGFGIAWLLRVGARGSRNPAAVAVSK